MATKKQKNPFTLIPEGFYQGELVEVSVHEGEHAHASLKFKITEGPYTGRLVFLGLGPGSHLHAVLDVRHQEHNGIVLTLVRGLALGSLKKSAEEKKR